MRSVIRFGPKTYGPLPHATITAGHSPAHVGRQDSGPA